MNIAITGVSGFLGKHLVNEISDENLYFLGRSKRKLEHLFGGLRNARLIQTDYSPKSLKQALWPVDAIVHLGGIRFKKELTSFSDYFDNVRMSDNLFKTCSELKIHNVIFVSTCSIYSDSVNKIPFREDEVVFPKNLYAISKLTAEKLGHLYKLNIKCLRMAQLVGPGEREGYMLMTFISRALREEPLVLFGEGKGQREYLYVNDATASIIAAMNKPEVRGIFNIGSGISTSHRQLAEAVRKTFGKEKIEILVEKHEPEDTSRNLMDSFKAREILNWEPKYSLEEGLLEMYKAYESEDI